MEKNLNQDWISEGSLDFEYKKYILLAYLQYVDSHFGEAKLYPPLSDLMTHYRNLTALKNEKSQFEQSFPKSLSGIDAAKLELTYEKLIQDDKALSAVNEIVEFAIPQFAHSIEKGKSIYDLVEEQMALETIGLLPLYINEGYLLLHNDKDKEVNIFRYRMSMIELGVERYRALYTTFIDKEYRAIGNSFENIKLRLAKNFADLPNPATYLINSKLTFPLTETLLPVAKRLLIKELSIRAA